MDAHRSDVSILLSGLIRSAQGFFFSVEEGRKFPPSLQWMIACEGNYAKRSQPFFPQERVKNWYHDVGHTEMIWKEQNSNSTCFACCMDKTNQTKSRGGVRSILRKKREKLDFPPKLFTLKKRGRRRRYPPKVPKWKKVEKKKNIATIFHFR